MLDRKRPNQSQRLALVTTQGFGSSEDHVNFPPEYLEGDYSGFGVISGGARSRGFSSRWVMINPGEAGGLGSEVISFNVDSELFDSDCHPNSGIKMSFPTRQLSPAFYLLSISSRIIVANLARLVSYSS